MGSEHIAHIRVIQVLPVADNWIDEDAIGLLTHGVAYIRVFIISTLSTTF